MTEGLGGLMTGIVPRASKRAFQTGLAWALYEELLPLLSRVAGRAAGQQAPGGGSGGAK